MIILPGLRKAKYYNWALIAAVVSLRAFSNSRQGVEAKR